jgi:RimJ/RimL family protein N-acetyltransferase
MGLNAQVKNGNNPDSFQVEVRNGGRIMGQADFFRQEQNGESVWGARVDVREKAQGQGVATLALQKGDEHIRLKYPNHLRQFEDLNSFTYDRYLNRLEDGQLVDYREGRLRFKP